MDKDLRKLIKALEADGYQIVIAKSGHIKVYDEAGRMVAVLSGTPSDWRSRRNELRELKRRGFRWPPK